MENFTENVRKLGLKVAKTIGNAANSVAASANKKVDKINLESRRYEVMSGLSCKCYELWKSGEKFPEDIDALLNEVAEIDQQLKAFEPVQPEAESVPDNEEVPDTSIPSEEQENSADVEADVIAPASEEPTESVSQTACEETVTESENDGEISAN